MNWKRLWTRGNKRRVSGEELLHSGKKIESRKILLIVQAN